ncbi:MAG: hypothetical protein PVJ50_05035 [Desulfobacterales bacterium]|jgi:hypothetical protein
MAIILKKLFLILRLVLDRTLVVWPCLFLIVLNAQDAPTKDLDRRIHTVKIKSHERRMGPFKINEKEFTVILKIMKYQGDSKGFDETVESFSIVDKEGEVHYQKSFEVEYGNGRFAESVGICAYTLNSRGRKGLSNESGRLKEFIFGGDAGIGLILYYGVTPSAPSSGVSCQVFTLKDEHLVSLFSPLTVYGQIYELPHGSNPNALRLFDGNTMKFGVWTGWFEVIVPVKVLDRLRVVPLHYYSTFGYNAFDVIVERRHSEKETFVRFFKHPEISFQPRHVIIKKETKVEFLWAYARVSIESGGSECVISIDEMPWLKVRIDGKEGFVRDAEDLLALGIRPAG